jgi:hypothetical protein
MHQSSLVHQPLFTFRPTGIISKRSQKVELPELMAPFATPSSHVDLSDNVGIAADLFPKKKWYTRPKLVYPTYPQLAVLALSWSTRHQLRALTPIGSFFF